MKGATITSNTCYYCNYSSNAYNPNHLIEPCGHHTITKTRWTAGRMKLALLKEMTIGCIQTPYHVFVVLSVVVVMGRILCFQNVIIIHFRRFFEYMKKVSTQKCKDDVFLNSRNWAHEEIVHCAQKYVNYRARTIILIAYLALIYNITLTIGILFFQFVIIYLVAKRNM